VKGGSRGERLLHWKGGEGVAGGTFRGEKGFSWLFTGEPLTWKKKLERKRGMVRRVGW